MWVGSSSTLRGLERFTPTLSAIGRAVPGTRLKLVCDRFIDIPDLPVDQCPWNEATEASDIASASVGIGGISVGIDGVVLAGRAGDGDLPGDSVAMARE